MDESSWFSYCEGNVQQVGSVEQLRYHDGLNAIVALGEGKLKVFDASSGVTLQESVKYACEGRKLQCLYHKTSESIAVTDGTTVGYRCHNNGVLLVNNVLQAPVSSPLDVVTVELPISEARLLSNFIHDSDFFGPAQEAEDGKKAAANAVKSAAVDKLLNSLLIQMVNVKEADNMTLSGKWATVQITLPYTVLKTACQALLVPSQKQVQTLEMRSMIPGYSSMTRSNYGLPIISSILHQLVLLMPSENPGCTGPVIRNPSRELMYSELTRRATFTDWPHFFYKYALPNAMAQAGFFHQPASFGDDRAMCFACNVCLVCWEPSDEPWSEHERHSPSCPFVCCEPTVNVPLSVTHATYPAQPNPFSAPEGSDTKPSIDFFDVGDNSGLLAAASKSGLLAVWDVNETPQLVNVLSIGNAMVLNLLRPYLRKQSLSDAKSNSPNTETHSVVELTVTSIHVLDRTPPESTMATCDPAEFINGEVKPEKITKKAQEMNENQKQDASNPLPHKVPVLVVGVVVTVASRANAPDSARRLPSTPHRIGPGKQSLLVQSVATVPDATDSVQDATDDSMRDATSTSNASDYESAAADFIQNAASTSHATDHDAAGTETGATSNSNIGNPNAMHALANGDDIAMKIDDNVGAAAGSDTTADGADGAMKIGGSASVSTDAGATTSKDALGADALTEKANKISGTETQPPVLHQFSLLLFIQPTKTTAAKSKPKPAAVMDTLEDDYYPSPDSAMTNGLGTVSVPHTSSKVLKMQQQIPNLIEMAMHSSGMSAMSSKNQEVAKMELSKMFHPDEIFPPEMFTLPLPLPVDESLFDLEEENVDQAEMETDKKPAPVKILQTIAYDLRTVYPQNATKTPTESGGSSSHAPPSRSIRVIDHIKTSEDGRKLLVMTRPLRDPRDTKRSSSPDGTSPMEVNGHVGDTSDTGGVGSNVQGAVGAEDVQGVKDAERSLKNVMTLPLNDAKKNSEEEFGRLIVLELEPADCVYYVNPKAMFSKGAGTKALRMSPCVSLLNLPSELLRAVEEDEYVDSLDGEEEEIKEKQGTGRSSDDECGSIQPCYVLILTESGEISIVNIETLEVVHTINATEVFAVTPINSPETPVAQGTQGADQLVTNGAEVHGATVGEKFTALTFCTVTERLCVATDSGKMAFLKIGKHSHEKESGGAVGSSVQAAGRPGGFDVVDGLPTPVSKIQPTSPVLLVNQPLTTETLKGLLQLTKFEPLKPRYTATAPNCWTEVPLDFSGVGNPPGYNAASQDKGYQKQTGQPAGQQQQPYRRHLLHPNQHYPVDMGSHSRAWRLQPDCLSWNEHLFELVFPRQTNISHIDLRFVLNANLKEGADIQVSLIKHPGLTTSKNEILRNEHRRKWRHHGQHGRYADANRGKRQEHSIDLLHMKMYSRVQHLLTENFVDRLMENNVDNPILYVAEKRQTSDTSVKEYVLIDGSAKRIVCVITNHNHSLSVGQVVIIKDYMSCRVGNDMSNLRIIARATEKVPSLDEMREILSHVMENNEDEEIVEVENEVQTGENDSSNAGEISLETEESDGDILDGQAPPPYSSLRQAPPPFLKEPIIEEDDAISQDGSAVLFGPVSLSDYTDASGIGGVITIASRRLLKDCRHRAVLIHIEDASDQRTQKSIKIGTSSRDEWLKRGCNYLQEIAVTVHRIQRSSVTHERAQKVSLFEAKNIHEQLLSSVCCEDQGADQKFQAKALPQKTASLDILNWVAAMETADPTEKKNGQNGSKNVAGNSGKAVNDDYSVATLVCPCDESATLGASASDTGYTLHRFMETCFLQSGRDVAVRALKLIFNTVFRNDAPPDVDAPGMAGIWTLAEATMSCLEEAVQREMESAFGMYCLFQIMNIVIMTGMNGGQRSKFVPLLERCLATLSKASSSMKETIHPLHLMLRAKYGLYGTPFDPERFIIHSVCTKPKHTLVTLGPSAAVELSNKQNTWEKYFSGEELNIQDLITPKVLDVRRGLAVGDLVDGVPLSRFGLFDCQPLHFVCVSASEGCSVGFDCDFDPSEQTPEAVSGAQPWGPGTGQPPKPNAKFSNPEEDLKNQLLNMAKISKSLPFKTYKPEMSYVGKMAKKFQQDTAVKRHFTSTSKETSDRRTSEEEQIQAVYDRSLPMDMAFPNLPFSLPPLSILTVSRMHSGARRSVVLDLGQITEVTDVHIASCPDLSSLVLDAWSEGTKDAPLNKSVFTHVGMTLDICDHDFILSNMSPPVLCRYIQVTIVGRYGTTNAQSRISLGRFYGRPACVGFRRIAGGADPGAQVPSPPKKSMKDQEERRKPQVDGRPLVIGMLDVFDCATGRSAIQRSLSYLHSCQDDVECRYGLACNQLQAMLSSAAAQSTEGIRLGDPSIVDSEAATRILGLSGKQMISRKLLLEKLQTAYYKCIQLQIQMSRVTHTIRYMESILGDRGAPSSVEACFNLPHIKPPSYTQLQTYCELMLSTLLSVPNGMHFGPSNGPLMAPKPLVDPTRCSEFFRNLCCHGNPRIRIRATCVLLSYSSVFPWWGKFISDTLASSLGSEASHLSPSQLPPEHVFSALLALGQRCIAVPQKAESLVKSLLKLLRTLLAPLQPQDATPAPHQSMGPPNTGTLDLNLLTWVLLYITHVSETVLAHNEQFMAEAASHGTDATASASNEASATVKNSGKSHKIYYNKFTQTPPQGQGGGPSGHRSNNMKPSASTRETRYRSRWNFVSLSEQEFARTSATTSGYMKILNSMKSVQTKLRYHKSELNRIFKEKKDLLKAHENDDKMLTDDTTEQVLSNYEVMSKLKDLNDKASEHLRGIVGFRRILDRKSIHSQLNRAKPQEGTKAQMGCDSTSWMTAFIGVSVKESRAVVRSIIQLLLSLDFTVPSDFIVLACKLASQLCRWCSAQCINAGTKESPAVGAKGPPQPLCLSELFQPEELQRLLLLAVGGTSKPSEGCGSIPGPQLGHPAGPWVNHALVSLLQDILESENLAISQCEDKLFPEVRPEETRIYWYKNFPEKVADDNENEEVVKGPKDDKQEVDSPNSTEDLADQDTSESVDSGDDEHIKRITLVDTYLSTAGELLEEIKAHMKAHGEPVEEETRASNQGADSPQSGKSSPKAAEGVNSDDNLFKDLQNFLSGRVTPKPSTKPPVSAVPKAQSATPLHYHHNMSVGMQKAISKAWWGTPKHMSSGQPGSSSSSNARARILNSTAASRQLLCSHAFDSRYVHGVSRHVELQQKLCTMAYLKLVSKSITHPPTVFFNDAATEGDDCGKVDPTPYPERSYEMLRSCFCELLHKAALHSTPLPPLLEIIILLQNTFKESLQVGTRLSCGFNVLLSENGVMALLSAANSSHGNCFYDNPQLWSLILSLLKGSIQPRDTLEDNGRFFQNLVSPDSGLVQFFTSLLSYKLAASNVSASNFNQMMPLLGPSIETKFADLLMEYKTMAMFYHHIKRMVPAAREKHMIHLFRDTLLLTLAELAKRGDLAHTSAAPTDGQLALVDMLNDLFSDGKHLIEMRVCRMDAEVILSIVRYVTESTYRYLQWSDTAIKGKSDGADPRMCMSGLFTSIARPGSHLPGAAGPASSKNAESPRDALMLNLLKLCSQLVTILTPEEVSRFPEYGTSPASVEMADSETKQDEPMEVEENSPKSSDGSDKIMSVDEESKEKIPTKFVGFKTFSDVVLQDDKIMHSLLSSLTLCNSSAMTSVFSGLNLTSALAIAKSPVSTGGGVFVLLAGLVHAASDENLAVKAIFKYTSSGVLHNGRYEPWERSLSSTCQLSVPLLWFILHVLENPCTVQEFCRLGGAYLIADSLVASARESIDRSPSRTSQMLRYMAAATDRASALAPRPPVVLHNDTNWPALPGGAGKPVPKVSEVLGPGFNYMGPPAAGGVAPPGVKVLSSPFEETKTMDFSSVATIECDDNSSAIADSLLKPKAVQRRSRSPSWSYHFPADRQWVALTLHFPVAFVLKSVQLHPMLVSLTNTPACIVLETNRTGAPHGASYHPVSVPLSACGHGEIVIHPPMEEVVTSIRINMKRPVDSSSIGLTRIVVNGVPTFMSYDHAVSKQTHSAAFSLDALNAPSDTNRRSAMNWLRLLHHCMTIDEDIVKPQFIDTILDVKGLIPTLCTLLQLTQSALYSTTIESVLVETRVFGSVTELINCLLRGPSWRSSCHFLGGQANVSTESSINVLHRLALIQDNNLGQRIEEMLNWVENCGPSGRERNSKINYASKAVSNPSHIHVIACALWSNFDVEAVKNCVTLQRLQALYKFSQSLGPHHACGPAASVISSPLKRSLDWLLCSFCYINIDCYTTLLDWMGLTRENVTINLTVNQLNTLSAISQSPECLKTLKSKGILQALSHGLNTFCFSVMEMYGKGTQSDRKSNAKFNFFVSPDNVIAVVSLFSDLCSLRMIQDWLGSDEGEKTWFTLLQMLCQVLPVTDTDSGYGYSTNRLPRYLLLDLQESTVVLIKRLTTCHLYNQQLFTKALCDIVSSETGGPETAGQLTGFVRSLLLRVVLEDEQFTVSLISGSNRKLHKGKSNSCVTGGAPLRHPMFGTGHFTRMFEIGLSSKMRDIRAAASDAPSLMEKLEKQKAKKVIKPEEVAKSQEEKSKSINNKLQKIKQSLESLDENLKITIEKEPLPAEMPPAGTISFLSPHGKITPAAKMATSAFLTQLINIGQQAQDKRNPNAQSAGSSPPTPSEPEVPTSSSMSLPVISLKSPALPQEALDNDLTLLQLLAMHKASNTHSFGLHVILELNVSKGSTNPTPQDDDKETQKDSPVAMETNTQDEASPPTTSTSATYEGSCSSIPESSNANNIQKCEPLKTTLEVFASLGGLALVAQRLPAVALDMGAEASSSSNQKPSAALPRVYTSESVPYPPYATQNAKLHDWLMCEEEDMFGFEGDSLDEESYEDPISVMSPYHPGAKIPLAVKKPTQPHSAVVNGMGHPCVPSHTMSALCLFLRVPFFAEEFLAKQKQARCLLRLMLGVLDDGQGEQIMKLDLAQSLPMLPFSALRSLLAQHCPSTKSGITVRRAMTFDTTSIHLVLACLSRFTHNEPSEDTAAGRLLASLLPEQESAPINVAPPTYKGPTQATPPNVAATSEANKQGEKNYWAKGTGFGTGSTTSDWDVGDAVKKQKKDEGYITVLLEVLAHFVCPDASIEAAEKYALALEGNFASVIPELITSSGLIPAIASYLRNDSVLDMAHHVPLYSSLLSVIRAFALCPTLCRLLMDSSMTSRQTQDGNEEREKPSSSDSVLSLLSKMRKCIDTYASRLKAINTSLDSQGEEGLTGFVSNVQNTETMLRKISDDLRLKDSLKEKENEIMGAIASSITIEPTGSLRLSLSADSLEHRYVEEMKVLQFDTAELVLENDDGKLTFPSGHHYSSLIKETANVNDASRARRLAQETVTLSNSLPLSHSSTVFVRCDEERLDVMKVLITGPSDTPYANGCFEFDVFFPGDYNRSPPLVNLQTNGNHSVRFNPNLYNDGKVCLSILNTWHGRPEEKWNPHTSSFLQILVSIQSLILVSEPYFNEPGYERSRGTRAGKQSSKEYDANIQQATVRWAMLEQMKNPSPCFKEVIERHFWLKRNEVLTQCNQWAKEMEQQPSDKRARRTILHNFSALQRHTSQLRDILMKMKCPEGLEDTQWELKPEELPVKTDDEQPEAAQTSVDIDNISARMESDS